MNSGADTRNEEVELSGPIRTFTMKMPDVITCCASILHGEHLPFVRSRPIRTAYACERLVTIAFEKLMVVGQINVTNVLDRSSPISFKSRKNSPAESGIIERQTTHVAFPEKFHQQKAFVVDQLMHHCVGEGSNFTYASGVTFSVKVCPDRWPVASPAIRHERVSSKLHPDRVG